MVTLELAACFDPELTANCVRATNVRITDNRLRRLPWHYRLAYGIKKRFSISPEEMAKTYLYLALSPDASKQTGLYFDEHQKMVPVPTKAQDRKVREKLWNATDTLLEPWMLS